MIYLDHAATTPMHPAVLDAMRPHLEAEYGNPSSSHAAGRAARAAVEEARERVATALGVPPLDVVFTSGGTEADNAAVKGIAWAGRAAACGAHVVTTAIEHHAVLDAVTWLGERQGFEVTFVRPEPDGVVDPERLLTAVRPDTVLVSVMAANNEIGTLQPLAALGPALADRGVPLHSDAVQAFGRVPLDVQGWHLSSLAMSGHKIGGPKGVGVMVLRRDVGCESLLHGGGQERALRSGTFNTPGIVGLGVAAERAAQRMPEEAPRLRRLRDRLIEALLALDGVRLNGSRDRRLPHNVHVSVEGCDGDLLLMALDRAGVAASAASACQAGAAVASHVVAAIGAPTAGVANLRLSCGWTTTDEEVERAVGILGDVVGRLRSGAGALL